MIKQHEREEEGKNGSNLTDELMHTKELLAVKTAELALATAALEALNHGSIEAGSQFSRPVINGKYSLPDSQQSLRAYVLAAGYPLIILRGPDMYIELANQPQADLLQRPVSEICGRYLLDLLPEIIDQPFPRLLKEVYETGISYKKEEEFFYYDTPEGQVGKYVSIFYDPLRNSNGEIDGLIASAQDITEVVVARKELLEIHNQQKLLNEKILLSNKELAQALKNLTLSNIEIASAELRLSKKVDELAESEARISYMLNEAPVAICILTGHDHTIDSVNNKMLEIWGKQRSGLGKTIIETLPEIAEQPFIELLDQVFATGITYFGDEAKALLEHDGVLTEVYVNFVFQPIKGLDGLTRSIIVVAVDITEQVMAKIAVTEKNELLNQALTQFEFLANTVPIVVWTATADGLLDYINQRWYDRNDDSMDRALGTGWAQSVHPDDQANAWKVWSHSLSTGEPYQVEFRVADKLGDYRWYLVRALALRDDKGEILKWYGSNTDITEQKELQRQKDDFLGIASHELKTPVTSIKAYTQLMEMKFDLAGDLENSKLARKMDKQVNRLTSLIEDLLDVTKINSGRMQFNEEVFDFDQMVEDVIEDFRQTAPKHQINKELSFRKNFNGDRDRIWQVVTNLISNAVKYSPDADRIILSTEFKDDSVVFCVQDFGIGIKADNKDQVFEQFYRVSGSREHTFPGLGLGLYISSEIVKRLGGKIWVNSIEDEGSTFCFSLPVNAQD